MASRTTPIEPIKHAAIAERRWFQHVLLGPDAVECDGNAIPGEGSFVVAEGGNAGRRDRRIRAHQRAGRPALATMWFLVEAGRFWFSSPGTIEGRPSPFLDAARDGRDVAAMVATFDPPHDVRQVRASGPARLETRDVARVHRIYERTFHSATACLPGCPLARRDNPPGGRRDAARSHTDATAALDPATSKTCLSGEDVLAFLSCGPRCSRRPVAWLPEVSAAPCRPIAARPRRAPH